MPEYLAPGVYVEEIERGPKPIEGVATSTAAFLGETERGPVEPLLVTSFNQYVRLFGSVFADDKYMPYAVSSFFENGGRRCYIARIAATDAVAGKIDGYDYLTIKAVGPGDWSDRLFIKITKGTTRFKDDTSTEVRIQLAYWRKENLPKVELADGDVKTDPFVKDSKLLPRPDMVEDFNDIDLMNPSSPNYYAKRIGDNSSLIRIEAPEKKPDAGAKMTLELTRFKGGDNSRDINDSDYLNENEQDVKKWQGLRALTLDQYREVALVYSPNAGDGVVHKVVSHCEKYRFSFAVVDALENQKNPSIIDPRTNSNLDTKYAAFYYPWIMISDPQTGARRKIPPGGAMLGIYARSDSERGVFKAPANEVVRGALDLEYHIDEGTQEVLNPRGVNVIRQFPGRGIRVWGARTLSSDTLWKYVPVRRLFIFLEHSIYDGTQWVVFEPNDERLWARVKDTIRLFLRTQWREGALMGTTEAEAFTIVCDRTTMTQDDILNGRLICEIGIAPVRPAEFVIFRLFQMTAEAQT